MLFNADSVLDPAKVRASDNGLIHDLLTALGEGSSLLWVCAVVIALSVIVTLITIVSAGGVHTSLPARKMRKATQVSRNQIVWDQILAKI